LRFTSQVKNLDVFYPSVDIFFLIRSFSSTWKKTEPKEDARVPHILRVAQSVDAARGMLSGKASSEVRRAAIARL